MLQDIKLKSPDQPNPSDTETAHFVDQPNSSDTGIAYSINAIDDTIECIQILDKIINNKPLQIIIAKNHKNRN